MVDVRHPRRLGGVGGLPQGSFGRGPSIRDRGSRRGRSSHGVAVRLAVVERRADPTPRRATPRRSLRLRFVLPPDTTPALRSLLRVDDRGAPLPDNPSARALDSLPVGSIIEACPEGLLLAQDIADRIEKCRGGAALIVDHGDDGSSGGDTLRGFWKHAQVHPLSRPGEVDVTADVDFGALRGP